MSKYFWVELSITLFRCWRKYTHFTAITLLSISCGFLFRTERVLYHPYNCNDMNILKQSFKTGNFNILERKKNCWHIWNLCQINDVLFFGWCIGYISTYWTFLFLLRVRLEFFHWMWNFQMKNKSFLVDVLAIYVCMHWLCFCWVSDWVVIYWIQYFQKIFLFFTFLMNIHDIGITVENNITIIKSLVLSKYGY